MNISPQIPVCGYSQKDILTLRHSLIILHQPRIDLIHVPIGTRHIAVHPERVLGVGELLQFMRLDNVRCLRVHEPRVLYPHPPQAAWVHRKRLEVEGVEVDQTLPLICSLSRVAEEELEVGVILVFSQEPVVVTVRAGEAVRTTQTYVRISLLSTRPVTGSGFSFVATF